MSKKPGGVVNATIKMAAAASLLAVFMLTTACSSGMSVKQGGEEFSVKADKYYEALSLQDDGDYFESIRAWSEVLDDEPRFAQGQFNLGLLYDMLNLVPEAIEHYELAVQAAEESRDLIKSGNEARESAADIKASIALYNTHLGAAYLRGGLIDEAIKALKAAETDDGYNPTVHYNLSAAYMAKGNYEMALKQADIAVDLFAKPDSKTTSGLSTDVDTDRLGAYLVRQGKCHMALKEWDKAKICLDRVTSQCHMKLPPAVVAELDAGMKAAAAEETSTEE